MRKFGKRQRSFPRHERGLDDLAVEVEKNGKKRQRSIVGFHAFRHTCASLLFDEGRNIKQVSEWLGHSDPGFTLRTYVHLMDAGVGDADFFDDVVERKQSAAV
jgi:integrase